MFTSSSAASSESGTDLDADAVGDSSHDTAPDLSRRELLTMISAIMALTAVAIDLMLPVFDDARDAFGLREGSADTGRIVTVFFIGMALGQIGFGPVADRFGRKRTLYIGIGIYLVGAIGTAIAPTFDMMLASRFLWGIGAAGGRVIAVAVVRDRFEGDAMAAAMSRIMAVFMLVPVVAPSLGAVVVAFLPWRGVFWVCVVWAAGVLLWSLRLPETLRPEHQRSMAVGSVGRGYAEVVRTRITGGYTLASVFIQAVFTAYVASSDIIIGDIFDLEDEFPFVFGAIAVMFGIAAVVNGRLVASFGTRRVVSGVFTVQLPLATALVALSVVADGTPDRAIFLSLLAMILASFMFLMPNLNADAMLPVGHIAGTASALTGAFRLAAGAVLGTLISSQVTDSVTPFALGVVAMCASAAVTVAISRARSPQLVP